MMLAGVTAAALCGGAALALTSGNALREVIRLAGGLAVLLAVLQPLAEIRMPDIAGQLRRAVQHSTAQSVRYEQENAQALADAAVQEIEAGIAQRAGQLGVPCTVDITAVPDETGRTILTGVTLTAAADRQAGARAVEDMIAAESGIPKEFVTWNWTD